VRTALVLAALPLALAACPGPDDPAQKNPPRLWLALDGGETMVRLVPREPFPF
jgi:hypothetical protein